MIGQQIKKTLNVHHDGDSSADDYAALFFVTSSAELNPNIHFTGVSIVSTGEVRKEPGIANMARLISNLKLPFTQIGAGDDVTLSKEFTPFPTWLRDKIDMIFTHKLPNIETSLPTIDAVQQLKETAIACRGRKEKLTLLCTGPLTNVANFMKAHPDLISEIENIVIMGGNIDVEGNVVHLHPDSPLTQSECNIAADPTAAAQVFRSGAPITLVPIDVTNTVPFTEAFYAKLQNSPSPRAKLLYRMLKDIVDFFESQGKREEFFEIYYLWDPLAAMLCITPELAQYHKVKVTVDEKSGEIQRNDNGVEITFAHKLHKPEVALDQFLQVIEASMASAPRLLSVQQSLNELSVEDPILSSTTPVSGKVLVASQVKQAPSFVAAPSDQNRAEQKQDNRAGF